MSDNPPADESRSLVKSEAEKTVDADEQKASKDAAGPKQPIVIPPPPQAGGVQVALGLQLLQQASSFDHLPPETQQSMITLAGQMDRHAFENAQSGLEHDSNLKAKKIDDEAKGRRQVLMLVGFLGGAALIMGTAVTLALIFTGQAQLGHTVMMSGLGVIGALIGGAGLSRLLQR